MRAGPGSNLKVQAELVGPLPTVKDFLNRLGLEPGQPPVLQPAPPMGTPRQAKIKRGYDPSVDRQRLNALLGEFEGILQLFCEPEPLVRGAFVTLRRRCGKPGCRCRRGRPHETRVFLERRAGRRLVRRLLPKEEQRLRRPARNYRTLLRLRSRLSKLLAEALRACDRLSAFREREGRRLYLSERRQA